MTSQSHTEFALTMARVRVELARANVDAATVRGCTQAIKAAQEASRVATHTLMAMEGARD